MESNGHKQQSQWKEEALKCATRGLNASREEEKIEEGIGLSRKIIAWRSQQKTMDKIGRNLVYILKVFKHLFRPQAKTTQIAIH